MNHNGQGRIITLTARIGTADDVARLGEVKDISPRGWGVGAEQDEMSATSPTIG